jgi:hypothetical protein
VIHVAASPKIISRYKESSMRNVRVLALTLVVALSVAAPSFAKVCHPMKPVTCDATGFSRVTAPAAVAPAPAPAAIKPAATTLQTKSPAKVQQAMACGPWIKGWACAVPTLSPAATPVKIEKPAKVQHAMACGPWVKGWACRVNTLV